MERTSDEHLHRAVRTAAGRADGGVAYGTRAGNPRKAVGDNQVNDTVLGDAVDRVRRSAGLHLSQQRQLVTCPRRFSNSEPTTINAEPAELAEKASTPAQRVLRFLRCTLWRVVLVH